MKLTIHGMQASRAMRVLWLAEELGLDYTHVPSVARDEAVRALNGTGKIPVLVADDLVVTDSTAILFWLADHAGAMTAPPGSPERARRDALVLTILDELETPVWAAAKHSFILPKERRIRDLKDTLRWEFAQALGRLAERLGGAEYLSEDGFGLADIVAGHCLDWAQAAKFPDGSPEILAYHARLRERPAYGRAAAR